LPVRGQGQYNSCSNKVYSLCSGVWEQQIVTLPVCVCHANAGVINTSSDPSSQIFFKDMNVSLDPGLNEQAVAVGRVALCLHSRPTVRCSGDLEAERYEVTEASDLHYCGCENYGLLEFDTVHSGTCERNFRRIMEPCVQNKAASTVPILYTASIVIKY
jgi:hypothetical protein